jgi:mannitol-1-/sugar-/sorbitol-6-phosphatase
VSDAGPLGALTEERAGDGLMELRVAAIISDMDGVLVDTGGIYDRHWELWADAHGIATELIGRVHFGRPAAETIRIAAPDLDPVLEARRFNESLAADPSSGGVVAIPGAVRLSAAIPAHRWAIATSAPRVMAERWLASAGLSLPGVIVTVDDVEHGKPAPDPYLRAAALLGVDPGRCLVLEDAPAGVTAARLAGATVLGVLSTHDAAALAEAHHLVTALEAVDVEPDAEGGDLTVRWAPAPR